MFQTHFQSLYTAKVVVSLELVLRDVDTVVTAAMNLRLLQHITLDEVQKAAFSLGASKALGLDGFSGQFYQSHWSLMAGDIYSAVQTFFRTSFFPKSMNHTHIALIPKILNPTTVSHYRPISLCNFSYKIILKLLVNRLRPNL